MTSRPATATDSANVAPSGPVINATNTLSRTPIPPGTPTTTNPTIHDNDDANSMSTKRPGPSSPPNATNTQTFITPNITHTGMWRSV